MCITCVKEGCLYRVEHTSFPLGLIGWFGIKCTLVLVCHGVEDFSDPVELLLNAVNQNCTQHFIVLSGTMNQFRVICSFYFIVWTVLLTTTATTSATATTNASLESSYFFDYHHYKCQYSHLLQFTYSCLYLIDKPHADTDYTLLSNPDLKLIMLAKIHCILTRYKIVDHQSNIWMNVMK